MDPLPDDELRFLQRFVTAYNAGEQAQLSRLADDSAGVILVHNFVGERDGGEVYPSLQALFSSSIWLDMTAQGFSMEFSGGPWVVGSKRPTAACRDPQADEEFPQDKQIVYGKLMQPDYFLLWDGAPIHYDEGTSVAFAASQSRRATHFVYSKTRSLGFVFKRAGGSWSILGIDVLAPAC